VKKHLEPGLFIAVGMMAFYIAGIWLWQHDFGALIVFGMGYILVAYFSFDHAYEVARGEYDKELETRMHNFISEILDTDEEWLRDLLQEEEESLHVEPERDADPN